VVAPIIAAAAFTRYRAEVMGRGGRGDRCRHRVMPGGQNPQNPRKNLGERSEFGFTETLSAATILAPQAIPLDAAESAWNHPDKG